LVKCGLNLSFRLRLRLRPSIRFRFRIWISFWIWSGGRRFRFKDFCRAVFQCFTTTTFPSAAEFAVVEIVTRRLAVSMNT